MTINLSSSSLDRSCDAGAQLPHRSRRSASACRSHSDRRLCRCTSSLYVPPPVTFGRRLLGLRSRLWRLLLGTGNLGSRASGRLPLDPGWWGWEGGGFLFHEGYWGPVVGFYGGINYGYGYFGHGYEGGRWDHDQFYYNRAVNNVNVTNIHNVYNTTVINNNSNHVSYNGGNGGITARPTRSGRGCGTRKTCSARSGSDPTGAGCSFESAIARVREPGQAADRSDSQGGSVSRQRRSTGQTGWRPLHSSAQSRCGRSQAQQQCGCSSREQSSDGAPAEQCAYRQTTIAAARPRTTRRAQRTTLKPPENNLRLRASRTTFLARRQPFIRTTCRRSNAPLLPTPGMPRRTRNTSSSRSSSAPSSSRNGRSSSSSRSRNISKRPSNRPIRRRQQQTGAAAPAADSAVAGTARATAAATGHQQQQQTQAQQQPHANEPKPKP